MDRGVSRGAAEWPLLSFGEPSQICRFAIAADCRKSKACLPPRPPPARPKRGRTSSILRCDKGGGTTRLHRLGDICRWFGVCDEAAHAISTGHLEYAAFIELRGIGEHGHRLDPLDHRSGDLRFRLVEVQPARSIQRTDSQECVARPKAGDLLDGQRADRFRRIHVERTTDQKDLVVAAGGYERCNADAVCNHRQARQSGDGFGEQNGRRPGIDEKTVSREQEACGRVCDLAIARVDAGGARIDDPSSRRPQLMRETMQIADDDLVLFERQGAPALPAARADGFVEHDGARIWHAVHGEGPAIILLHGGLGNAGNWGYQVPALVAAGRTVIVIDSRGHGRSTRDAQPFGYGRMAEDALAVMDHLGLARADLVGWSDGACTALILGDRHPERVSGVFFFACNMDPSGTLDFSPTPRVDRCFSRHRRDYEALSATPAEFDAFVAAVSLMMQNEPNYTRADLAAIRVPVTVAIGESDEFIRQEHAVYLAQSIPGANLVNLPEVSHFAPLQRPDLFNRSVLRFLDRND